jgi:hypothetical protein
MATFLLGCFLLSLALPAALAQQPVAPIVGSNWSRVQALPAGTTLHLNGKPHTKCVFVGADADSITCSKSGKTKSVTYPRAGITSIKLNHQGRSALVGLGIGAGAGAIIGFAEGTHNQDGFFGPNFLRGALTAVGGALGAVVGTPIGYFSDFTAGSAVYKTN